MPTPLRREVLPGGGTGVAEAMAGVSGDIQKDIQAKKMLDMPGLAESMGSETANWIKSGPGVHKRLGQFLQHADKATGGKVSQIRQALDIASRGFGGKMPANQQEALRGWMTAVDQVNQSGRGARIEREEAMKIFEQGWSQLSGRPAGMGGVEKDPRAIALKRLGQIETAIVKLKQGDKSAIDRAMISMIAERNPELAKVLAGPQVDIGTAVRALEEEAQHLRGGAGGPTTPAPTTPAPTAPIPGGGGVGGGGIRVREKSSGRTGTIPEGQFDANLYDRL